MWAAVRATGYVLPSTSNPSFNMRAKPKTTGVYPIMPHRDSTFRRKGIYLLPNLFTTGALFAGFYAIIAAMVDQHAKRLWG
jgi:hypothetical protein